MPTLQYTVRQYKIIGNIVDLIISGTNWEIDRQLFHVEIDTKEKLAQWIVDQTKSIIGKDADLEGTFDTITEIQIVQDPETGEDVEVEVILSVTKT